MKRRTLTALLCALPLAGLAAGWPDKPVKLVVPFPPGSITDVVARALAEGMGPRLGQAVVIDNKAGANGIVGTVAGAKAPADGYTLFMVGVSSGASNVSAFKSLPYDPKRDFAPIGLVAEAPFILISGKHLPVKNLQELITHAKASPKKLNYGYGSGSAQLTGAQVVSMGGFSAVPVPYRGVPQAVTDVIAGQIDFTIADMVNGVQQAKAGRVTALGVTSKKRSPLAPEIPSLAEAGLPDYDLNVWFGVAAPAGTPAAVVQRVNTVLREVLADPALQKRFEAAGISSMHSSPEAFAKLIETDIVKWGKVFRDAGLTPE